MQLAMGISGKSRGFKVMSISGHIQMQQPSSFEPHQSATLRHSIRYTVYLYKLKCSSLTVCQQTLSICSTRF